MKGSMTIEAACVTPLFLFLLLTILSLFEMLIMHSVLDSALQQVGKEISTFAYVTEDYESTLLTELYVKERVIQIVGRDRLNDSVIVGGAGGIMLWRTTLDSQKDTIDLVMTYRVRPRFHFFHINEMVLVNRCYVKAYTGYKVEDSESKSEYFYVTDKGEVYHVRRSCPYLQPSVTAVQTAKLSLLRNEDGSKYKPCEICLDSGQEGEVFYVTTWGEHYHSSIACTGLKRTIYVMREEQLGGRRMCTKCMGGEL